MTNEVIVVDLYSEMVNVFVIANLKTKEEPTLRCRTEVKIFSFSPILGEGVVNATYVTLYNFA